MLVLFTKCSLNIDAWTKLFVFFLTINFLPVSNNLGREEQAWFHLDLRRNIYIFLVNYIIWIVTAQNQVMCVTSIILFRKTLLVKETIPLPPGTNGLLGIM